jgi:hypothetical protein
VQRSGLVLSVLSVARRAQGGVPPRTCAPAPHTHWSPPHTHTPTHLGDTARSRAASLHPCCSAHDVQAAAPHARLHPHRGRPVRRAGQPGRPSDAPSPSSAARAAHAGNASPQALHMEQQGVEMQSPHTQPSCCGALGGRRRPRRSEAHLYRAPQLGRRRRPCAACAHARPSNREGRQPRRCPLPPLSFTARTSPPTPLHNGHLPGGGGGWGGGHTFPGLCSQRSGRGSSALARLGPGDARGCGCGRRAGCRG